ncbi:hypothetical protein JR316_0001001 [Psilocybe cubensis]|uniref:Uncharacterized protein n=1 Tax=Psilocybe cubensis TaxID=181762 RepID=A0ACB8HI77_PSICU|nr:hypothetical protein JR316_0001001 [Psilocybe cubensis]KAH9486935.1 hypothetical protein JR316_0001001 [Psilocybe cubensis]
MLSLYPQTSPLSLPQQERPQISELGSLREAISSFTKLTADSGTSFVRLYCTVPTFSYSTDTCLDLHDLNELRSRFLPFVHDLLQSLRSSGISATYSLAPSNSSLCLVSQKPINTPALLDKLDESSRRLKREQVALVDLDGVSCLIIT